MTQTSRDLGDILLQRGLVTPDQLTYALNEEARSGQSAWRVLLERGSVSERDLVTARAAQVGMGFADVRSEKPHPGALTLVPAEVARRQQLLPMASDGQRLTVAMAEPTNHYAIDEVHRLTGLTVTPVAAMAVDLSPAIEEAYAGLPAAPAPAPPAPGNGAPADPEAAVLAPEHPLDFKNEAPPPVPVELMAEAPPPAAQAPPAAAPPDVLGPGDMPLVEMPSDHGESVEVHEEGGKEPNLADFLNAVINGGASDLHLTAGIPPMIRVNGDLQPIKDFRRLEPKDLQEIVYAMLTQGQREQFEENLELDVSYSLPGRARFRVNVFRQRDALGTVMRLIPYGIKSIDDLGLPPAVKEFTKLRRGLVLVTGVTGSGKSTTLAGLVDIINGERAEHIMTVEDPIEFLHQHKTSIVNQREVGEDTKGFAQALRHVLRQDPDVILVGEMRDLETIQTALTAAETGHLVFATLHTQDAPQSVDRVIDVFPPHQQQQIRVQLAATLAGVVSQQLLPTTDGKGRAVAVEVLVCTAAVRNLIREGKTHQIYTAMQAGGKYGMQVMDQHLAELVKKRKITYEMALERCHKVEEFNRLAGRKVTTNG